MSRNLLASLVCLGAVLPCGAVDPSKAILTSPQEAVDCLLQFTQVDQGPERNASAAGREVDAWLTKASALAQPFTSKQVVAIGTCLNSLREAGLPFRLTEKHVVGILGFSPQGDLPTPPELIARYYVVFDLCKAEDVDLTGFLRGWIGKAEQVMADWDPEAAIDAHFLAMALRTWTEMQVEHFGSPASGDSHGASFLQRWRVLAEVVLAAPPTRSFTPEAFINCHDSWRRLLRHGLLKAEPDMARFMQAWEAKQPQGASQIVPVLHVVAPEAPQAPPPVARVRLLAGILTEGPPMAESPVKAPTALAALDGLGFKDRWLMADAEGLKEVTLSGGKADIRLLPGSPRHLTCLAIRPMGSAPDSPRQVVLGQVLPGPAPSGFIWEMDRAGTFTLLAGRNAKTCPIPLGNLSALALGRDGTVFIAEQDPRQIRKLSAGGRLTTHARLEASHPLLLGGPHDWHQPQLPALRAMALEPDQGLLAVASSDDLRVMPQNGAIFSLSQTAQERVEHFQDLRALCIHGEQLLFPAPTGSAFFSLHLCSGAMTATNLEASAAAAAAADGTVSSPAAVAPLSPIRALNVDQQGTLLLATDHGLGALTLKGFGRPRELGSGPALAPPPRIRAGTLKSLWKVLAVDSATYDPDLVAQVLSGNLGAKMMNELCPQPPVLPGAIPLMGMILHGDEDNAIKLIDLMAANGKAAWNTPVTDGNFKGMDAFTLSALMRCYRVAQRLVAIPQVDTASPGAFQSRAKSTKRYYYPALAYALMDRQPALARAILDRNRKTPAYLTRTFQVSADTRTSLAASFAGAPNQPQPGDDPEFQALMAAFCAQTAPIKRPEEREKPSHASAAVASQSPAPGTLPVHPPAEPQPPQALALALARTSAASGPIISQADAQTSNAGEPTSQPGPLNAASTEATAPVQEAGERLDSDRHPEIIKLEKDPDYARNLIALEMNDVRFQSNEALDRFAKALAGSRSLKYVAFRNCQFHADWGRFPWQTLMSNRLVTFVMSGSGLDGTAMGHLAPLLHTQRGLEALDLSMNMFSQNDLNTLCDTLWMIGSCLKMLNMSGNPMAETGDNSATTRFLSGSPYLIYLNLNDCRIGNGMAEAILPHLEQTRNLRTLLLRNNNLQTTAIGSIAKLILSRPTLDNLDVGGNPTTPAQRALLQAAGATHATLNQNLKENLKVD